MPSGIEGMVAAYEHAGPIWASMALTALKNFIEAHPKQEFVAPVVISWAEQHGTPEPPHKRAWGGVFAGASRNGVIRHVGHTVYSDDTHPYLSMRVWSAA